MLDAAARDVFKAEALEAAKTWEAVVLRLLEELSESGEADMRWISIARTNIEQGFMAAERAIIKPAPFVPGAPEVKS